MAAQTRADHDEEETGEEVMKAFVKLIKAVIPPKDEAPTDPPAEDPDVARFREMEAVARIRSTMLSDECIELAYLVGDGSYDKAAEVCRRHLQTLNQLAGLISQLLPKAEAKKP